VKGYYSKYERYLAEYADFARLVLRSLHVKLALENSGTLAATGIDVHVTFPSIIVLYGDDDAFAPKPTPPEAPPLRPMGPGAAIMSHAALDITPFDPHSYLPRSTRVYPEERRVHFTLAELKHNHLASFDPFFVSFATADAIGPFDAEYVITAREPIDPIRGTVHFNVQRDD
jgi:hypothetical protein